MEDVIRADVDEPLLSGKGVDDPLSTELNADALRRDTTDLHDLTVRAIQAPKRLSIYREVHHRRADEVNAGRAGRRALKQLHRAGTVAGGHAPRRGAPVHVQRQCGDGVCQDSHARPRIGDAEHVAGGNIERRRV